MSKSGLSWSNQEVLLPQLWLISQNGDLKELERLLVEVGSQPVTCIFESSRASRQFPERSATMMACGPPVSITLGVGWIRHTEWYLGASGFHNWRNGTSYTLFVSPPHLCLWSHGLIRLQCSYPTLPGGIQNYSTNCSSCLQDVICLSVSD